MFEKIEILLITFVILAVFYMVIWLGSKNKKKDSNSSFEIKKYMLNVKILILFIAVVFLLLWSFS
tara:strand:+ start:503 stop:697 length:195 start_codon:yes stop_codon:yes gene_type:complete